VKPCPYINCHCEESFPFGKGDVAISEWLEKAMRLLRHPDTIGASRNDGRELGGSLVLRIEI